MFFQECPKKLFCSQPCPEAELFISQDNIPQREFYHFSEPHYKKPLAENPGTPYLNVGAPVKTGREEWMKVPYDEGIASHIGPE